MTIPSSGPLAISNVTTELGLGSTYSASLSFLNGYMLSPTASPNLGQFYGLTYFQNNNQGNCDNGNCGNCNCPSTNCTNCNCNCGNIQCTQCLPYGAYTSQCSNCSGINCTNCQSQSYLQANCNCSGGYACNCNDTVGYNCGASASASYNCNCACNCSKIICAKLYEFGLMNNNIWAADQAYGQWLRKNDRRLYRGYVRWARIVTAWMDGKGPDFMVWIKDDTKRAVAQKIAITDMAIKIGTPWSEHMAYLMGEMKNDNTMGRILMRIGTPISKFVDMLPRTKVRREERKHNLATLYTMWALFYFSYYTAKGCTKVIEQFNNIKKIKVFKELKND